MDALLRDLRFGIRMLVKRPGLSLTVIVTFALGIGLTTTVFSIVNGAMFKGLPFERADRVMLVGARTRPATWTSRASARRTSRISGASRRCSRASGQ
jgi:hypothetical protein